MEEFVSQIISRNFVNKGKFRTKYKYDYLKQVFNSKKINKHRNQPLDEKKIWNDWPESMKNLYNYYFDKNNLNEFCKYFNYETF